MPRVPASPTAFSRDDEASDGRPTGPRLESFLDAVWKALVPKQGECRSVQGQLVLAIQHLQAVFLRDGPEPYYDTEGSANRLVAMLRHVLDTLVANRGEALDPEDVAFFASIRAQVDSDWRRGHRRFELLGKANDETASADELAEIERLEATPALPWPDLFARAERCVANYCLVSPVLVDRAGAPTSDQGVRDLRHVFAPPPPTPVCASCGGKGWVPAKDASSFPTVCSCRSSG